MARAACLVHDKTTVAQRRRSDPLPLTAVKMSGVRRHHSAKNLLAPAAEAPGRRLSPKTSLKTRSFYAHVVQNQRRRLSEILKDPSSFEISSAVPLRAEQRLVGIEPRCWYKGVRPRRGGMIFVVASWASMLLALALAWLWLQGLQAPPGADAVRTDNHARASRTTLRAVALLAALSTALLLLHFLLPAREAAEDREWVTQRANTSTLVL
jgi:hypothetical protein